MKTIKFKTMYGLLLATLLFPSFLLCKTTTEKVISEEIKAQTKEDLSILKTELNNEFELQQPSVKILTLDEAISLAHKNKPSIQALNQAKKVAEITQKSKMTPYLPQVTTSASYYNVNNSAQLKNSVGIGATQLVYSFAGPQNTYNIAQKDVNKAEWSVQQHKNDIRLEVERTFINAWLLQKKEDLIVKLYVSAKDNFKKSLHEFELAMLGKSDWLQAQVDLSGNLVIVQSYQDDLNITEQSLSYLLGQKYIISNITNSLPGDEKIEQPDNSINTNLAWSFDDQIDKKMKTLEEYYQLAIKNRTELKIKDEDIAQKRLEGDYYMKKYLPSVSLFGNYSRNDGLSNSYDSKDAGVRLTWNVFDGLTNYFNKNIASGNKLKTELEKQDLTQAIKLDVQTAFSELQKSLKSFNTALITYQKAKNDFELQKQKLDIGELSQTDFKAAEYVWQQAEYDFMNVKVNLSLKERTLAHACGYPETF